MNFSNRLKGNITQALLKALLEDSHYHIVSLGIEECIRNLSLLDEIEYKKLQLPDVLRKLPDFFVSDQALTKSWLIEVKYRKEWSDRTRESLGKEIYGQVKNWGPLYLMVFLGTSAKEDGKLPSSYMGILRLEIIDGEICATNTDGTLYEKWSEINWRKFFRIQDVFPEVGAKEKWSAQTLQQVSALIPQLKALDVFE